MSKAEPVVVPAATKGVPALKTSFRKGMIVQLGPHVMTVQEVFPPKRIILERQAFMIEPPKEIVPDDSHQED